MSGHINADGTATVTAFHGAMKYYRRMKIMDILARNKIVRFTHATGYWKDADKFDPDKMGDIHAFRMSDGVTTDYVCWDSTDYDVSEVER